MKTVIFDLDGTLLNTLDDLTDAVNFALNKCAYPLRTKDEIRRFVGNGVIKLMTRATPDDISNSEFEHCFKIFRARYLEHMTDKTEPYGGTIEFLEKVKFMGVKTAVVSNKLHAGVVGLCEDFFAGYFDCVFGVEEERERKPAPVNVIKAMKITESDIHNTIYIGDSEVDVQTAKNANLPCIGVSWGFRDKQELYDAGCIFVADTWNDVLNKLSDWK